MPDHDPNTPTTAPVASTTASTPPVAPSTPIAVAQMTAPPTTHVQLSPADYQALVADRAALEAMRTAAQRTAEETEQRRLQALAEKGQVEQALKEFREAKERELAAERDKVTRLETQMLAGAKDTAIAKALGVVTLRPELAGAAYTLVAAELESVRDAAGQIVVVHRFTRQPADEWIKVWLASPTGQAMLLPTTTGGSGASGGGRPAGTTEAVAAKNLGEAVTQQWLQAHPKTTGGPIGLRVVKTA